jgi:hypothetical protein
MEGPAQQFGDDLSGCFPVQLGNLLCCLEEIIIYIQRRAHDAPASGITNQMSKAARPCLGSLSEVRKLRVTLCVYETHKSCA